MPKPWKVTPAIRIVNAYFGGCEEPNKEARVPHSMTGKTGKIQAGVND
jgi:hypothetical protein